MRNVTMALFAMLTLLAAPATMSAETGVKPGATFRDCDNCPEMVVIPEGEFVMDRRERARPVRRGRPAAHGAHPPIRREQYDVTRGQWAAFVSAKQVGAGDGCAGADYRAPQSMN